MHVVGFNMCNYVYCTGVVSKIALLLLFILYKIVNKTLNSFMLKFMKNCLVSTKNKKQIISNFKTSF